MATFDQRSGLLRPRYATVSMNPDAPQEVNPAGVVVKQYAHAEDTGGIPLDELQDLLGVKQQTFLAEITGRNDEFRYQSNGIYTANLYPHSVTSQIVHVSDFIRVTCTRNYLVDGTPTTDTWEFRTNSDNWFQLTEAEDGDILVSEETGILLRSEGPENDYVPATIYIGRSEDNEVLVQTETLILPINHPEARMTVRIEFETYAGGLLGRRIGELRSFSPQHKLAFKRKSVAALTLNDAPDIDDINYNGQTLSISADSDWVVASAPDPSGVSTLYFAGTTATYDQVFGTWTIDNNWTISSTAPSSTDARFAILFSTGENGERHSPRADSDDWVWLRKPDGYWEGFPFDQNIVIPDRNWRTLATWTVLSGEQPYTGYIPKNLTTPLDISTIRDFKIHFRHYTEHHENETPGYTTDMMSVQNPLAAGADFPASGHDNLVVGFPENAAGFAREDDNHPGGSGFRFSMRFERGSDPSVNLIERISIGDWITSTPAVITLRVF